MLKALKIKNLSLNPFYISIWAVYFLVSTSLIFFSEYADETATYYEIKKSSISSSVSKAEVFKAEFRQTLQIKSNRYSMIFDPSKEYDGPYDISFYMAVAFNILNMNHTGIFDNIFIQNSLTDFIFTRAPPALDLKIFTF